MYKRKNRPDRKMTKLKSLHDDDFQELIKAKMKAFDDGKITLEQIEQEFMQSLMKESPETRAEKLRVFNDHINSVKNAHIA